MLHSHLVDQAGAFQNQNLRLLQEQEHGFFGQLLVMEVWLVMSMKLTEPIRQNSRLVERN